MSKEIDTQQILLQEDSHANHSALQEREKEHQMTATSGMKLLESSESVNLDGSLGKMLKALLTSKTAWCSDRSTMTWKAKVSKCKVLLFQLAVSVRGIKESVSGLSAAMYPTPSASCQMDVVAPPETVKQNSIGWSVTRVGTGTKFGAKLNDVVNKVSTKVGGKLNPTFCEMLMGYPMNWTKIEQTELNHLETQSFHKSQEKSEKQ